ncbi:diphthine--ammonia ligase [Osmerus eperlanus]|uniref:diphthine--ammonia ligase n=1 Tax=Osmerus eperlanus TaxID=29151 RepID=UPI002E0E9FC9
MKVVALISGGKDSCYNMMQCVDAGHRIVALANLRPANTDELDSYMYQTVGHQAIDLYAEAMELPLYRRTIRGASLNTGRDYRETEGDEVEDLYQLLLTVKEKEGAEAVSVGAILSDYQRVRVENVCMRLGLQPLAFLWRRDQETLLSDMISADLHALLIKVAALGLDPEKHLGQPLAAMEPYLNQLHRKYGIHVCGEGGEYETFTLDCPLFKKRIVIDAMETVIHSADAFAPVGYLRFTGMHTENKDDVSPALQLAHVIPPCSGGGAGPLPSCPCQSAIDRMTEEAEYADQAQDIQLEFTSNADLSCQSGRGHPPSCSPRTSRGYQWFSGAHSPDPGIHNQTMAALHCELETRGWQMTHVVLLHLYVRSMEDFSAINAVYRTHFGHNPPARVCVQAPLPPGQLLQVDCLLQDWPQPAPEKEEEKEEEDSFHQREALHVQSLSHWAPANIGPYSQALRVDEAVFCAGQIALVPCSMQLVKAGVGPQARLSFSHVEKVLEAVVSDLTLAHVLQAHCYATRSRDVAAIREVWESKLRTAASHEELSGEPEVQRAPLVVAVVPALPRGAAVELHVTAVLDTLEERTSCHMTTELACGSIECWGLVSSTSLCATLSLALSVPSAAPAPADTEEILRALCATFQRATQKMAAGLTPLCARVFYKCGHSLSGRLVAGLEECLRMTLDQSSPAVVLVPVLDLPDSLILHLSCWLSL